MAVTITINGQAYPCRQTMGAMLRFRRETGREVTQMGADALSDMAVYLWFACGRRVRPTAWRSTWT